MRLLIAAGGTGGHIYPALAVARSLRAGRPRRRLSCAGSVATAGSRRSIVPAAGIPMRRLALRSLRTTERDVHVVLDPIRLGVVGPAGDRDPRRGAAGGDLHDRRLRRDARS